MARVALTNEDGSLKGAVADWVQGVTDAKLDGYTPVDEVMELGEGFGVAGPDGLAVMLLDGDGNLHPQLGAATAGYVDAAVDGLLEADEVTDIGEGFGVAGPDGAMTMILDGNGSPHPNFVAGVSAQIHPVTAPKVPALTFNAYPTTTVATLSKSIMNQANRYHLNVWFPANFPGTASIVSLFGNTEQFIRRPSAVALSLATAVATGTHDATATGHSSAVATSQAVRLIDALAKNHLANGGDWGGTKETPPINTSDAWGWQAALWAYYTAAAAWLVWSALTDAQKLNVARMIAWEADRMLRWRLPFWTTREGGKPYGGDSKSEEISWDAAAVMIAAAMMPHHEHAPAWNAKLVEMGYASHSGPADLNATTLVHGFTGQDVLSGYNINADGTVINHDRIHPDYMVSAGASHFGCLAFYGAAKQDAPRSLVHNVPTVYSALSTVTFSSPPYDAPGGTIYVPNSYEFYYPQGNDWGTHRVMDKALMDVQAARYGWDAGLPTSATTWAELHLQRQADLQARGTDGRTYQADSEDTYTGREQWVAANAAFAVLTLAAPVPRWSNAVPEIITTRNRSV